MVWASILTLFFFYYLYGLVWTVSDWTAAMDICSCLHPH